MSGLTADARTLIDHARVDAQNYRFTYDEPISVQSLTQSICDLALRFGEDRDDEDSMSRPFGVALLMGGVDETGPILFHMDPSGTFLEYKAMAIGAGSEGAQQHLEKEFYDVSQFSVEVTNDEVPVPCRSQDLGPTSSQASDGRKIGKPQY
eukprot:TRINITY_DN2816_c0_g1_i6.p1 TRINITY_DN2816_c0_g1~~TRINITY_DN2816_c0_g1_i6.p1  ORF type:complete len:151 (+),score=23.85 TRINITY_DN2816_c0_g1_i6:293-745(+)